MQQFDLIVVEFESRFGYSVCECGLSVGQKNVIIADQGVLSMASVSINFVGACAEIMCLYID